MLVVSKKSRLAVLKQLSGSLRAPHVIRCITLRDGVAEVETMKWRQYWSPCFDFFATDTRIIHRLNHLKSAWREALLRPRSRQAQAQYCWRYFGLLRHAIGIAQEENRLKEAIPAFRRVIGFETFTVNTAGSTWTAAGAICQRNPIYMLGRLPKAVPYPSTRHIPVAVTVHGLAGNSDGVGWPLK